MSMVLSQYAENLWPAVPLPGITGWPEPREESWPAGVTGRPATAWHREFTTSAGRQDRPPSSPALFPEASPPEVYDHQARLLTPFRRTLIDLYA